jgi:2-dehydro-3-deoxyglucarate aldolase/4-hydroxy-2-oxoheptanedioate aldolase
MDKRINATFRERLRGGELLLGTLISLPLPELAAAAASAGFDWLFLDMEHGAIGPEHLNAIFAALPAGCAGVVRVPETGEMWVKKALDAGAAGVITPHTNSAAEAARAAAWCRYAPEGERSLGFTRSNRYGLAMPGHLESANREVVYIPQVEHIEAVRNIEAVLAVHGVDAVFVGPFDLSASLGIPGRVEDRAVLESIDRVREACRRKNVAAGIFAREAETAASFIKRGFTLMCVGVDIMLYREAAEGLLRRLSSPRA